MAGLQDRPGRLLEAGFALSSGLSLRAAGASDDIVVCAEADTVRDAVAVAERALPDVVVMDVRLQDGSGVEATRDTRAARPATQALMLTSFADDEALFASIMAGTAAYLARHTTPGT
jgi:DNA-binding NarL/FixJ family response regulator